VKLVVEYNKDTKNYILSEKDKDVLKDYIPIESFFETVRLIETNVNLRPFDKKTPIFKTFSLKLLTILILIIYIYVCFILLQLALFNLIMLGVILVYFKKLYFFLYAIEYRYDHNYRNS